MSELPPLDPNIKKVGRYYENPNRAFSYMDIPEIRKKEWIDASKYLPNDFDICHCKIENKEKILSAWFCQTYWDGMRIKPEDKVLSWRLNYDF